MSPVAAISVPRSAVRLDHALGLQLPVGPGHGVGGQPELLGQRPYGGQLEAGGQLAAAGLPGDLGPDLLVRGSGGIGVDGQLHEGS